MSTHNDVTVSWSHNPAAHVGLDGDNQPTLIPRSLYERGHELLLATSDKTLTGIMDPTMASRTVSDNDRLFMAVGSEDWCVRMVAVRDAAMRQIQAATTELDQVKEARDQQENVLRGRITRETDGLRGQLKSIQQHLENLGQALLEQAVDKDWCSEYDDFAEQWGLPRRFRDFAVTINVRVSARDEDTALELVRDQVDFSTYHDGFSLEPSFEAEEVN